MEVEDVIVSHQKRIGAKDQGAERRARFILLEFMDNNDRNKVKKESEKLKANEDTKLFYLKADKTKKEREEYKRLNKMKEELEKDNPERKKIEIKYGKLYVNEAVVDRVETENYPFLE